MGRVIIAIRAFFAALFNGEIASRVDQVLKDPHFLTTQSTSAPPASPKPVEPAPPPASKNEALILLSTLQREARLVDFLKEDLSNYSDDQVGAAVREMHRDAGKTLDRLFAIQAIVHDEEGSTVEVPKGFDAARFRLTGKLSGEAPFRGALRHHGWVATQSDLPAFTGNDSAVNVIAPAEVELP